MIDRVMPLELKDNEEAFHICTRYRDSIKTMYCKRCDQYERRALYVARKEAKQNDIK